MDIVSIRAAQLEYGDSLRSITGYKVARGDAALVLANVPQFMIDAAQYGENLCGKVLQRGATNMCRLLLY